MSEETAIATDKLDILGYNALCYTGALMVNTELSSLDKSYPVYGLDRFSTDSKQLARQYTEHVCLQQ